MSAWERTIQCILLILHVHVFLFSHIFLPVTPLFSLCPHVSHITNGRLRMHAVPNYMVTLKLPQVHILPYTLSETLLPLFCYL